MNQHPIDDLVMRLNDAADEDAQNIGGYPAIYARVGNQIVGASGNENGPNLHIYTEEQVITWIAGVAKWPNEGVWDCESLTGIQGTVYSA